MSVDPPPPHCAAPDCSDEPGTFVLDVTTLAHGPDAVGRHEGRVIFVPGAAPGDRVRVRVVEQHGNYARAELVHRCSAGAAHREPPCPWIAECGGCPWQHVAYDVQVAAKAQNVRETLRRIAGVTPARWLPIVAAPTEWGYRHRIRLHVGAGGALGFRRPRSHALVAIEHCLIAEPELSTALAPVRALTATVATTFEDVELAIDGRGRVVVSATARGRFRGVDERVIREWLTAQPTVAGVVVRGRDWTRSFGDPSIHVTGVDDLPITQRAGSFTQVNRAANRLLVRAVVDVVGAATTVLDLFCGAGNLSLPLARVAGAVIAVDQDAEGIADGATSAQAAGLANIRFEAAAADRFLRRRGTAGADVVVLDPPRTGAAAVAAHLGRLKPARIVYVSCDPATLARDVRTLVTSGYTVDRVQPLDLFPQTEHVETVLEAVLTAS